MNDSRPVFAILLLVLVTALITGDPGRIDRPAGWLRVLTAVLIGLITIANAGSSIRLVVSIIYSEPFTESAALISYRHVRSRWEKLSFVRHRG